MPSVMSLQKNSNNEEDEDDRADREEYEEELRREMFEGSGQVPKHKRRRMSPAHRLLDRCVNKM